MGHILVVDDDPQVRKSVCRLLRALGYDARGVGDGATALASARADRPALVLLDVDMPGMSGFDVLRAVAADPALRGVPVVMATGGDAGGRDQALRLGARAWLAKGDGWPDTLVRAVERFAANGTA